MTTFAAETSVPPPVEAGKPVVTLRDITKVFSNGTVALDRMSLTIRQGEFLSLLGPSGCGKSTALRIVAGLGTATSGIVDWAQHHRGASTADEHDISFVFQEPTLMPWATVFNNVWLPLRLKKKSKAASHEAVIEALNMVGLADFADSYPRELSGGMKMRVSIARALVTKPRILLMDEPFAALDEITRFKLNNDLLTLWQRFGFTVVFVTHSVFESVFLSSRIVIMAAGPGRVLEEMAVDEPYPRTDAFRTSDAYGPYCRSASDALQRAIAAGGKD